MSVRPFSQNVIFIKEQLYCRLPTECLKSDRTKLDFWENSAFGEFPPPSFDWPARPAKRGPKVVLRIFHWPRATGPALILSPVNHCARTCCSLRIITRCRFMNWPIRCKQGGRNVPFLSINLISFRRSRGIVLVMASPAWETDSAGRQ